MKQYWALDDDFFFWFASNDTSGSGGDGASPAADVRLAGAAADAAPVYSPTPVLLSHVNYPAGAYEISIAATAANGFAANNTYAVFCTLLIDSQNPTGFVGSFDLKPVEANVTQIGDTTQSATDLKDFADAGYDPGANKVQGVVLVDTVTTLTGHTAQSGDNYARLGAPAGASIAADLLTIDNFVDELESRLTAVRAGYIDELAAANLPSDIDDILADTAEIGVAGAGLTNIPIETQVNDALIALKLDHLLAVAVGGTGILSDQAVANCIIALLASDDGDPTGYAHADDSLEAISDTIGAPAGASIAADLLTIDNFVDELESRLTAVRAGYIDELAPANLPSDIDDILLDTAEIGAAGAGLTAIPWNAAWDVEVESECVDALVAQNLDHLCKVATVAADMTAEVVDNSVLSRILSNGDTSVFVPSTDGLQPIRDELVVVDGIVDSILADTDDIGVAGAGLTAIPWNAAWDVEVESKCNDALVAQRLDHLLAVAVGGGGNLSNQAVANCVIALLASDDGDPTGYAHADDSLEAISDTIGAPAGASIAADLLTIDNFVDELESRLTAVRAGYLDELAAANLPSDIDDILLDTAEIGVAGAGLTAVPWNAAWDVEVERECNDALVALKLDHLLAVAVGGGSTLSDQAVANCIIALLASDDGDPAGYAHADDSLEAIRDRGDAAWVTGGGGTPADIADAVWDENLSEHTTSGTAGKIISSIKKLVDAILGLIS